ncbi:MAG: hypothetical protein MJ206_02290 [Bacilli bacterium]|nr:hypothetical protein [Bacilli bacterium]
MEKYESEFMNALKVMEILKKCPLDVFLKVYYKVKGTPGKTVMKKKTKRITIAQLVEKIDGLSNGLNSLRSEMNAGFKQVNTRIDGLETRIDRIETRLDYIVTANNLKDQ